MSDAQVAKHDEKHDTVKHDTLKSEEKIITREMTIGDVVSKYPEVVETLLAEGVHCIGCGASYWETLEQGLAGHGKTDEEIDSAVEKLNAVLKEQPKETPEGIVVTAKAAAKIKEVVSAQKKSYAGLRIQVLPGGCSGYQYGLELIESANEDDIVIDADGVKFFVDNESMGMLKGAKVDYVETLQASGFKITNPIATKSCGCGNSFG